jgi:hypothetical protein
VYVCGKFSLFGIVFVKMEKRGFSAFPVAKISNEISF